MQLPTLGCCETIHSTTKFPNYPLTIYLQLTLQSFNNTSQGRIQDFAKGGSTQVEVTPQCVKHTPQNVKHELPR